MNSRKQSFRMSALLLLLATLVGMRVSVFAQTTTGTILGTVKDQTGAVLPGANITIRNVETGITRTSVTGDRGEYRVPALNVGTYEVHAELAGFQRAVRQGITLTVGREAVVDMSLNVGDVSEQVTVTGEAPLIETTSASVGGVVSSQQIRDIPLNARSFIELVPLQAGAVLNETGGTGSIFGFGKKLSIAGTRYTSNSFLLDGADINDSSGTSGSVAGTMAGVETVREFKVITNAYDSEYGRHTGGVVSAVTKSGTNSLHGSLFEFLRNDNLDAPRWEDNKSPNGKPEFRRNQFGGSLGGPILRDRTFFFGSYEGLREGKGLTSTYTVPGLAQRRLAAHPAIRPFLDAWPVPNQPDRPNGTAFRILGESRPTEQDFMTGKVDHRFNDSDSLFVRVNYDNSDRNDPRMTTTQLSNSKNTFTTVEETHIYSPALLGRTHLSFNRTDFGAGDAKLPDQTYPIYSFTDVDDVPGNITITGGYTAWGGSNTNPRYNKQNVWQLKEDVNYLAGRHALKFGVQWEKILYNMRSDFHAAGTFAFGSFTDFLNDSVQNVTFTRPGSQSHRSWKQYLTGMYLQDDFNIRQGLTLNLGLRYEFVSVPAERYGRSATIRDITPANLNVVKPEQTDIGPMFENPSLKNLAPRVGFAWDVFGAGKTSVRGGIGVFHDQLLAMYWLVPGNRVFPYYAVSEVNNTDVPGTPLDFPNMYYTQRNILLGSVGRGGPQIDGIEYYMAQPAVYKWNLDIEQQVARNMTVSLGYSGTRSTHLMRGNLQLNTTPALPGPNGRLYLQTVATATAPFRAFAQPNNPFFNRFRWRIMDGTSDYHGLRMSMTKRFSQGFQFQTSYTWARSIDDGSAFLGSGDYANDRQPYRTLKERALSSFDVRHSLNGNVVYDLPGARLGGVAGKLLGGWSLSSIMRISTGSPNSLSADAVRIGTAASIFVDGPSLEALPGANLNPARPQNPDRYIDPSQFTTRAVITDVNNLERYALGSVGPGTLIGPGIVNADITLLKKTNLAVLGEEGALEFRFEMFNMFHRRNFQDPGSSATNLFTQNGTLQDNAGILTATRESTQARQVQLGLRVQF